jgi:3-hydroxy acid dehydrogenase/malonic semialdehyde reductase
MERLKGRVAIVTGGAMGIGKAIALRLAQDGAAVVIADLEKFDRAAAEIARAAGSKTLGLQADVSSEADANRMAVETIKALGRIDILVNNAGLALGRTTILEADDDDERRMMETNVLGLTRMTRLCLPHMEDGRGHIVNLGSWAGREAYPQGGMYVGSKYAVKALTYVMRKELVGRIRVSTVDPGMVGDTEFSDVRFRGDLEKKEAVYRGVDYLTPADVADCILWVLTRPPHVVIDEIVVKPLQQASQDQIARHG